LQNHNFKTLNMKKFALVILVIILAGAIWSCGSGNKSKQIKDYKYTEEKAVLNDTVSGKVGSWIREGMICYGIALLMDRNGQPSKGYEVEVQVISIQPDLIKLKSTEELIISPVQGCTAIGMKKGEIWEEKTGELFRTREEAIQFIKTKYSELHYTVH
jgi:hypothetical protein